MYAMSATPAIDENASLAIAHNLNRLNETRTSIMELCGSDAHTFLKTVTGNKPVGSRPISSSSSELLPAASSSLGLDHSSKRSSDSIPDLVQVIDNDSSDHQQKQQPLLKRDSPPPALDLKGLETSSSFEKYSLVGGVETTTTANEESGNVAYYDESSSADTARNLSSSGEKSNINRSRLGWELFCFCSFMFTLKIQND